MTSTLRYTVSCEDQSWTIDVSAEHFQGAQSGCASCQSACSNADCSNIQALEHFTDTFFQLASFTELKVVVDIGDIRTQTQTTAQRFLSSLAGLVIALNSGCSRTEILRPMVHFHRPFMSFEESIYRSIANAALHHALSNENVSLGEYVRREYQQLHELNLHLVKHFQGVKPQAEPLVNALVNLDLFVKEILYNADQGFPDVLIENGESFS